MKKFLNLAAPSLLFLIFVFLISFADSFLPGIEVASNKLFRNIVHYCIQIGFWISGAHLLNVLVKVFFWEGVFAKTIKGTVPRLLTHFFSLIVYVIALFIIIGKVFGQELTGIWATSGVMALVLGFALRNMILDLFTGLAVNIEMPYKIGDWIQIHTNTPKPDLNGQVIDINWRATRLRDEERKVIIIPNSLMSSYIISNFTQSNKRVRFETVVRLDNSITVEKAKRIIQSAAKQATNNDGFFKEPEPSVVVDATNEFGVVYKVRYWINPWKGIYPTNARDKVNASIIKNLSLLGLTPSFPGERIYYSSLEGITEETGTTEYKAKLLRKISLFNSLSEAEINDLAEKISEKSFAAKQNLMEIGEQGDSMFILSEGILDVMVKRDNESLQKVGEINPGEYFGEMSLLTGEPRSATVTAATDIVALEIKKDHVENLFKKRPSIMEDISNTVALRTRENTAAMDALMNAENVDSIDSFSNKILGKIKAFFS